MFQEDYEKRSRSDKNLFSEVLNDLLYQCYICRKSYDRKSKIFRADPDYRFIERYYDTFEDYLSYRDRTLSKSDEDGVIFVTSSAERNHFRFDPTTTLIVFALRSYYENQLEKAPEETEVLRTSGVLSAYCNELGLSSVSKRLSSNTISSALRTLDGFNIVSKCTGSFSDPSYSFYIMPTIRYLLSSEKLNSLYSFLTKPQEAAAEPSLFDKMASETKTRTDDVPASDAKEGENK